MRFGSPTYIWSSTPQQHVYQFVAGAPFGNAGMFSCDTVMSGTTANRSDWHLRPALI